jgi:hypothetical protein
LATMEHIAGTRRICCADLSGSRRPSQGKPSSGLNSNVMLATSVQKLLDRTKRRKFSMLPPSAPFMFVNSF